MRNESRITTLKAERAELEKAIHVIWTNPEPISDTQRQSIAGMEAHLTGVIKELELLEAMK